MKNTKDADSNRPSIFVDMRPRLNKVAVGIDVLFTAVVVIVGPIAFWAIHESAARLLPDHIVFLSRWFAGARLMVLDLAVIAFLYLAVTTLYDRHF